MNQEGQKEDVLSKMADILDRERDAILRANRQDLEQFAMDDKTLLDRLKIDQRKVDGMIGALQKLISLRDPVGKVLYAYRHPSGIRIENRTAPFGRVMIIYESRPDVTIEAAGIAFKAGNKILLKGGKEAIRSNLELVRCWHEALGFAGMTGDWVRYLNLSRVETQNFLKSPDVQIDLIIPRGGEKLIDFVKRESRAPVLVSGRGNNFLYVHADADWTKALSLILHAKTQKISACNALDKVLLHRDMPDLEKRANQLINALDHAGVEILVEEGFPGKRSLAMPIVDSPDIWHEEFLDMKIVLGLAADEEDAIERINTYSGGHSVSILTESTKIAGIMMDAIDAAAVYHNASTRFTDGGEFGLGAEMAISTDKLHHRGPLGLEQMVTNKWYIFGDGQIRES